MEGWCHFNCDLHGCYAERYMNCGKTTWPVRAYSSDSIPDQCPNPEDCWGNIEAIELGIIVITSIMLLFCVVVISR